MRNKYVILSILFVLEASFALAKLKVVSISPEQGFYLNGGARAKFGGKSRTYVKIDLPKNTVEWYYTITTSPGQGQTATIGLASQLAKLVDPTGLTSLAVSAIMTPRGSGKADVYLFNDVNNLNKFLQKDDFNWKYNGTDSKEDLIQGTVQIKDCLGGSYYIGLRNPAVTEAINITIEVTAIVREESEEQNESQLYGNMGWKEYQSGNYSKCIEYSKKALKLDSTLCGAQFDLGLCWLVTNNDSTVDAYIKALAMARRTKATKQYISAAMNQINQARQKFNVLKNYDMIKQLLEDESKKYQ